MSIKFTWWWILGQGHGKDQARLGQYKLQLAPAVGKANLWLKGSTALQDFTAEGSMEEEKGQSDPIATAQKLPGGKKSIYSHS